MSTHTVSELNADGSAPRPKIGLGALIERDDKVLLGKRKGSHGAGEWCAPGGHLELGFTIFQGIVTEVLEETGLRVTPIKVISISDEMRYIETDGKHYVDIGILCICPEGTPAVMEPHKCEEWGWFSYTSLPDPLMESTESMIRNRRNGTLYQEGQ